jgi:hypothetical protein
VKYAFIDEHVEQHPVRRLCSVMQVHPSGYYAWKQAPLCDRAQEDVRVSALISRSWEGSGRVYGYRKVGNDLRDMGERCGKHRVARLMRLAGQRSHTGYKRRPGKYGEVAIAYGSTEIDSHRCLSGLVIDSLGLLNRLRHILVRRPSGCIDCPTLNAIRRHSRCRSEPLLYQCSLRAMSRNEVGILNAALQASKISRSRSLVN